MKPGGGYRVRVGRQGERSDPLEVLSTRPAPPSTDVYNQEIPPSGYGYLTTRDGTKLSYYVHPPQDVAKALPVGAALPQVPAGPTPTLIEYGGYGYADPDGPESGISIIGNLMGFTVVDVNMRGTGCSGGAFDFFEPLQSLDGYDVIETIARQPWVQHNKVGMMGISYGGISQLFTAQTNPPSLAAITPISLIDSTQTTLYPGGVLNTGFAVEWGKDRIEDSRPAGPGDTEGQRWAYERIQEGDQTCKENQALHGQAPDLMRKVRANDHYRPKVADPLAPVTFVDKIRAPAFVACQWQDEQTGGHCPTLASRFTNAERKWFTFTNGTHVDSLAPETANRWFDFLQLYVARRAPAEYSALFQAAAPVLYEEAFGVSGVTMPPDPIQQEPTYEGALAAFEALPQVRILFDNGAGSDPGKPLPGFEKSFSAFPVPGTTARSWYLGANGALADEPPASGGSSAFRWDSRARGLNNFSGSTGSGENGLWTASPGYQWKQPPDGTAASWVSAPLAEDTTVIGAGAVLGWVRSSKSQPRPPGHDQRGAARWQGGVRAGRLAAWERAPARRAKEHPARAGAEPAQEARQAVAAEALRQDHDPALLPGPRLPRGLAHPRDDHAPNGDQPVWSFGETRPKGKASVAIAHSTRRPSRLILPVVPGVDVPTELPPCPGLRGQPCRDFAP